jgi:RND family efflux transporter MFP subunit
MAAPTSVALVQPEIREITETIAASGIVAGSRETVVGAEMPGVVSVLVVREGERVVRGQLIARIRNEVAEKEVLRARQAVNAAHAQLRQAAARPRFSELEAARARVRQAEAALGEALPQIERAELGVAQAESAADQAEAEAGRARALERQAQARVIMAEKTAARYRILHDEGAISLHALDQAESELAAATADKTAGEETANAAERAIETARMAARATAKEVESARIRAVTANAALSAARADLKTLEAGPRFETVEVAREQVAGAAAGVDVAASQARLAEVRAPFSGIVTEILAEKGAQAAAGIVRLVESGVPEIRLSVDENNLADLRLGQRAIITSSAYRDRMAAGEVIRLGSKVDSAKGTVEVVVRPAGASDWLRPGQTVNVNVVLDERARRLVVPATAIRPEGSGTVALTIVDGKAAARQVETGHVKEGKVPVLSGLSEADRIILRAESIRTGQRVRAEK